MSQSNLTAVQAGSSLYYNPANIDFDHSYNFDADRNSVSYCTANYYIGYSFRFNFSCNLDCNYCYSNSPNFDYITDCNSINCNLGCRYFASCIATATA